MILFGYWHRNLGDDLMLKMMIEKVHTISPNEVLCILSKKIYKTYYENMGCKVVCSDTLKYRLVNRVLHALNTPELFFRRCNSKELFVALGGSLFAGHPIESDNRAQYTNLQYAVKKSSASFVVGSNLGPYTNSMFLEEYRRLFTQMNDVCLRDIYSSNLFCGMSRYAPDVVLTLSKSNSSRFEDGDTDLLVPINVLRRKGFEKCYNSYIDGQLEFIKSSVSYGRKVKIVSFCAGEGDDEICDLLCEKARKRFGRRNIEMIPYRSIDRILNLFANCHTVYATRFHSMILGLLYGRKVIPIVYSAKMKNALEDYCDNAKCVLISEFNIRTANESLRWSNCNNLKAGITEESWAQFEKVISNM